MAALGDEFRSAREARLLTLSDVAEKLHIRSVYLNAIEAEDWKAIGAPVYVRGFIRTYARFLGLDGEAAIAHYNETVPQERAGATSAIVQDDDASGPSLWAVLAIVGAIILVAFVGYEWWSYAQGNSSREPMAAVSPSPPATTVGSAAATSETGATAQPSDAAAVATATPLAATSAAPSEPSVHPSPAQSAAAGAAVVSKAHQLAIRLTERSWLRVTVDGTTVVEGIYPAGTARTFAGNAAEVRAGNGGGVSISVNGRPAVLLGKAGDVVEQRYTL